LPLLLFLFPLQHIKRPALQNKQVVVLRMAFRARKVLGTFEKWAPDLYHFIFGITISTYRARQRSVGWFKQRDRAVLEVI